MLCCCRSGTPSWRASPTYGPGRVTVQAQCRDRVTSTNHWALSMTQPLPSSISPHSAWRQTFSSTHLAIVIRCVLCSRHDPGMLQVCSRYFPDMFQVCSRYVPGMFQICSRYVPGMIQVCSGYVPDMFKVGFLSLIQQSFSACGSRTPRGLVRGSASECRKN